MPLISFAVFCMAASITPGPANIAILSVAEGNHGFKQALPFVSGVCIGFAIVLLACLLPMAGLSLVPAGISQPILTTIQIIGSAYLLYIAWKIFNAGGASSAQQVGFWHGLIIHPLSIKAWFFVLSAYSTFIDPLAGIANSLGYALVFLLCAIIAHSVWLIAGIAIKTQLSDTVSRRINQCLAGLLAAMVLYILLTDMF